MKAMTAIGSHPVIQNNDEEGENMSEGNSPEHLMLTANGSNFRPGSSSNNFQSALGGSGYQAQRIGPNSSGS